MEPEILFDAVDGIGTITLNRPGSLNALTINMVRAMRFRFTEWISDDGIRAIVIKGAGERAFCAGGDVPAMRRAIIEHEGDTAPAMAQEFFFEEYTLNHQIHTCPKPYIALIDRICMGGGVGLSVHGSFRVATERTRVGMPETTIGLFPDVGGGWFLSRLPGETGTWLALTGLPVSVGDCLALGIATHVVPSARLDELQAALPAAAAADDAHAAVAAVLDGFAVDAGPAPHLVYRDEIDRLFAGSDATAIRDRLAATDSEFAKQALGTLATKSPTSIKVTLEQIRRAARAVTFAETLTMEYRLSQHFVRGHDFPEGIRALLVDKDHRPNWRPAWLEDVSDEAVAAYFQPVPWRELVFD